MDTSLATPRYERPALDWPDDASAQQQEVIWWVVFVGFAFAVAEYLELVRALYGDGVAFTARASTLSDAFGLADRRRVRLGALSHGQRRVVSIVAALALRRALLVVDEATAALDPEAVVVLR